MTEWTGWREATQRALYGPDGFYLRAEGPGRHFRTSVHASPLFAAALVTLLDRTDAALGRPPQLDLVDVGAGRGELLTMMLHHLTAHLAGRLRPVAVELASRPPGLDPAIGWSATLPEHVTGLLVANEWLDNVPVDVAVRARDGVRLVLVDRATGAERVGGRLGAEDMAWLAEWWPLDRAPITARAEVGRPRDQAWGAAVAAMDSGLAVAVDYAHTRAGRLAGRHARGTLAAFRHGRAVPAVPDGSCDITAHVALDACAAEARRPALLTTQRRALRALGLRALGLTDPPRPDASSARDDPAGYLAALRAAGEAGELTAAGGLGGFGWLVQGVGLTPAILTGA